MTVISNISEDSLAFDIIENVEDLFLSAVSTLSEFRLAKQDSLFADYDIKRVKGQYAPYLSLFGNLSSLYQKLPTVENRILLKQMGDNFMKVVGVSLIIPIYNRHEIKKTTIGKRTTTIKYFIK
jgi:outer membrane protein TolC